MTFSAASTLVSLFDYINCGNFKRSKISYDNSKNADDFMELLKYACGYADRIIQRDNL